MFELMNLVKTYNEGDPPALRIDSLTVPDNQVVALVGFSGSGKTTLLNVLGLLDRPDSKQAASIKLNGEELAGLDEEKSRQLRRAFGFVFQQGYLLENLASRENLRIPPELNGLSPKQGVLDEMLAAVGLQGLGGRLPNQLSAGQRQRVAIMRALSHRPNVVFADEPTSSLDFHNAERMVKILRKWQTSEPGRTLLLVTHDTTLAVRYADCAVLMAEGHASAPIPIPAGMKPEELSQKLDAFTASVREPSLAKPRVDEGVFAVLPHPRSSSPRLDRLKVAWRLAWHDVFAQVKSGGWRQLLPLRILQFHSVASLSLALFLALLFARLFLALAGYLVNSVSDPYMNQVKVLRHRVSAQGLGRTDLEKVANLAWLNGKVQYVEPTPGLKSQKLVLMASPARNVQIAARVAKCEYPSPCSLTLLAVSVPVEDKVLSKIPVLDGPDLAHLKDSGRVLQSLFIAADAPIGARGLPIDENALDKHKFGVVCTPRALRTLGYTQAPQSLAVTMFTREGDRVEELPLLGIAPELPADKEAMITEGFFLKEYFKGGSDPAPDYSQISLYVNDLIEDGLPLCNALIEMDYVIPEGQRGRLVWVIQMISYVSTFRTVASIGLAIVVFGQLARSFWDAIRRKERQIGVLLAYGVRRRDLHLTFCLEVGLIWGTAALAAGLLDGLATRRLVTLAYQSIPNAGKLPVLPMEAWAAIIFGALVIAMICVIPALHMVDSKRVANMLKATN